MTPFKKGILFFLKYYLYYIIIYQQVVSFFVAAMNRDADVAMKMWNVDAESVSSPSNESSVLDILL